MFAEVNTIVGSSKFGQPNLETLDVETLFIEPGSPWENRYVEFFNRKLRYRDLTTKSSYCCNAAFSSRWNVEMLATPSAANPFFSTKVRFTVAACLLY